MADGYRTEKDSLGEMQVPEDALYGAQTQRAVENFPISGQRFGRRFIEALGLIKQSAAETNAELGNLDEDIAAAVASAAAEVAAGKWDDQFVIDIYQTGSGTSSNMNVNEVVAYRASELRGDKVHPNDHVNFGQSSNDVIPTAIHISARVAIENELLPGLEHLRAALAAKAEAFDSVVKSGRTHLMDATPVRLGQEFGGYATQVAKGIERVRRASTELEELALGGTATGTGINTHEDFAAKAIARLAAATGIAFREADDHFEAQGAKDAAVNMSGALNTVATSLIKIADDVRWLGSGPTSGLHEISLPAIQPGSSIMPGKVNPVMSEAMMMVAARVMGNHTTITVAGSRGNFELNVMMPVLAQALLESITLLGNISREFADRCVEGIEANPARAKELLEKNPSIATALNPYIGYDEASVVAKEAAKRGVSVREIVLEKGLLPDDQVDDALDVRGMTEPGLPSRSPVALKSPTQSDPETNESAD
jgi:fumarate hydratase class II